MTSATVMGFTGLTPQNGEDGNYVVFGNYRYYAEADYASRIVRGNVDNSARATERSADSYGTDNPAAIPMPVFRELPESIAARPDLQIPDTDEVTTAI